MSNALILPGANVYIEHANLLWNLHHYDIPIGPIPNPNGADGFNVWKLTNRVEGMTLDMDLEPPMNIVATSSSSGNLSLSGSVMLDPGIRINNVIAYNQNNTEGGTFYIVVCYNNPEEPSPENEAVSFKHSFSLPGIDVGSVLEVILFKEDPKTSRGTVTTVMHASHDMEQVK
jgi:hypothetical protein